MSSVIAILEEDLTLLTFEGVSSAEVLSAPSDLLLSFNIEEVGAEVIVTEKEITLEVGDAPLAVTTQNLTQLVTLAIEGPQGPPGEGGGGGSNFRPATRTAYDATYLFFGDEYDDWRVRRVNRSTQVAGIADISNNATVPDLATAWPLIDTLNYV